MSFAPRLHLLDRKGLSLSNGFFQLSGRGVLYLRVFFGLQWFYPVGWKEGLSSPQCFLVDNGFI